MEVVAWLGTAGNVAGGEAGGGGFPVSGEQGATGHGESSRRARWATRNPRSTMRRSAAGEGDHGHGAELVGGEVLRASYENGATGVGKAREREGKGAHAHSAHADVLKRARGGLGAAESTAKLVGEEEEDGNVGDDAEALLLG